MGQQCSASVPRDSLLLRSEPSLKIRHQLCRRPVLCMYLFVLCMYLLVYSFTFGCLASVCLSTNMPAHRKCRLLASTHATVCCHQFGGSCGGVLSSHTSIPTYQLCVAPALIIIIKQDCADQSGGIGYVKELSIFVLRCDVTSAAGVSPQIVRPG